jgi:hypothetical protein
MTDIQEFFRKGGTPPACRRAGAGAPLLRQMSMASGSGREHQPGGGLSRGSQLAFQQMRCLRTPPSAGVDAKQRLRIRV